MNPTLKTAIDHWEYVAPILTPPQTDAEYDRLVTYLDEILDAGGADENHPLALLADHLGSLVTEYEDRAGIVIDELV